MTTGTRNTAPYLTLAVMLVALVGCGDAGRENAPATLEVPAAVTALAVPAAAGSGQPFLEATPRGVWMSWTEPADEGHRVAASFHPVGTGAWSRPATVAKGDGFFVNWADFPSIRVVGDRLFAHWLWRGGQGTYDYGVRVAWSDDDGATWSQPVTSHEDGTPTEHGFASFFATDRDVWAVWLDGRAMVDPGGTMSLRARMLATDATSAGRPAGNRQGLPGPEMLVDG